MIVAPCLDAGRVNAVVNDPAVRPYVGPEDLGPLDLSPAIERPENLFLMGEYGGFGLIWTAPFTLEVHTFILPGGRGKWAREAAATGIAAAQERGALRLWTRIPPNALHIGVYARGMGMQRTGEVIETFGQPYKIMSMELPKCQQQ